MRPQSLYPKAESGFCHGDPGTAAILLHPALKWGVISVRTFFFYFWHFVLGKF
jgi:hypothetical protein